ncbi:MAG: right-handed parallel beta-helix repeat-containing protein [Methanomassiliicoccales archaeon]|jgi:parallel beta-helix repeat protein|nr:right-handed parallel beta-helix repeat-containing protein [Methanomassiliicoccales archaeon]
MSSDDINEREPAIAHVLGKRTLVYLGALVFLFALFLILNSGNASAAGPTYVYEDITTDTTWDEAGSPYILNASIEVKSGATLTIEKNVTVLADAFNTLTISGKLVAQGTPDEPILFSANTTYWGGLIFTSTSTDSVLSNAIIEYTLVAVSVNGGYVTISDTLISDALDNGLWWETDSDLDVEVSGLNVQTINGVAMMFLVNGGNATVSISGCHVSNVNSGIVVQATGWIDVTIADTEVVNSNLSSGVIVYSTGGDIEASINNLLASACYQHGVLIYAANGAVKAVVESSSIGLCGETGLQVEGLEAVDLGLSISDVFENAVGVAAYADEGDVSVVLSDVSLADNTQYALIANSATGNVYLNLAYVSIENADFGTGVFAESNEADLNAEIADTIVSGGMTGMDLEAGGNVSIIITDSVFVDNYLISIYAYADGQASLDMQGTEINNEGAPNYAVYYPKEIDYEYAIINPGSNYTTSSSMYISLPFEFPFGTSSYTDLYVYRNGYISVGSPYTGSFPIDLDSTGGNLIVPCQDNFNFVTWPYMSYKIYDDDMIVIQWWVYKSGEYPLTDTFEAVLYSNGDIQFIYAEMNSLNYSDYSNDYGVRAPGFYGTLNDIWIPNVYDADYRSIYLTRMTMGGYGLMVFSKNDIEASMLDSSISHVLSGAVFNSFNGDVSLSVNNISMSHVYGGFVEAGLIAYADNGTVNADVADSTFSYFGAVAVAFVSDPQWGGEDVISVTNNRFTEINSVSVLIVSEVYDDDGLNEIVEYKATRSIAQNVGENSGGIAIGTYIEVDDSSVWDIAIEESITENVFVGEPTLGMLSLIEYSVIYSGFYVYSYAAVSVVSSVQIVGNSIELPKYFDGIEVDQSADTDGLVISSDIAISENEIDALSTEYWVSGIICYLDLYSQADFESSTNVEIVGNEIASLTELAIWDGIYFEVEQGQSDGTGIGTSETTVVVEGNKVQGAYEGIYIGIYSGVYNYAGTQNATLSLSVSNNEIYAVYGIYIDVEAYAEFDYYYPPNEVEVSGTTEMSFTVDVIANKISAYPLVEWWGYNGCGIEVYTYAYVQDYISVFSQPEVLMTGTCSILENEIEVSGMADMESYYAAIYMGNDAEAYWGNAIASVQVDTIISGNKILVAEDSSIGYGIYVYDWVTAQSHSLAMDYSPQVSSIYTYSITQNEINGSVDYGIGYESYPGSYYGQSAVDVQSQVEITDNKVTDFNSDGIWVYVDVSLYQYSYYDLTSNAKVGLDLNVLIENNELGTAESEWADGIWISAYVDTNDYDENDFELAIACSVIGNTIASEDSEYAGGVYVESDSELLDTFAVEISGNTIVNAAYGIEVYSGNVSISQNTIMNSEVIGISLMYSTGEVVDNQIIGGAYATGIDIDSCEAVNISGNEVDSCGDGIVVEYSWDIIISENAVTNNGLESGDTYGLYIYDSSSVNITSNTISGNLVGVYIDYVEMLVFSDNAVTENVYDGAYFYECWSVIIENNIFSQNGGGLYLEYCEDAIIGNNTVIENVEYGLYIYWSYSVIVYNGVYTDNAYDGVYVYAYAEWIVDSVSVVRNNNVELYCDLTIIDGGTLTLDNVWSLVLAGDYQDGVAQITVEAGGTLNVVSSEITSYVWWEPWIKQMGGDYFAFKVYGTMNMDTSYVNNADELYLGPGSTVEIRSSVISDNQRNGIHVDNCSPVISSTTIIYNGMDGVFIEGEDAAPSIKDCTITMNNRGIYAVGANLANVIDNMIIMNWASGIYLLEVNGALHDNIVMFNPIEIYVKNSNVAVQDNQIGYSTLVDVMSAYAPLILSGESVPIFGDWMITPEMIAEMQFNHYGIFAVDSTVTASDNVYGMLQYAIYAVRSTITCSDTIEMTTLVLPYYDSYGTLWNVSLPIFVYDGIYASQSTVTINGGMIKVLDDAVFLASSTAELRNVVLDAGDFDIYLTGGSTASAVEVVFEKAKVEDTSVLTIYYKITVRTLDQDGLPVSGVWVVIYDEEGNVIGEGATDDNGYFSVCAIGFVQTSAGIGTARIYTVNASFDQGFVEKNIVLDKNTEVIIETPVEKAVTYSPGFAFIFLMISIFLVAVALLVEAGKK